jgi:DNA-binding NarL/FixJ family response regulator
MTGDISAKSRDTHRAVLSRRQIEVLRLAGCGLTAREIAAELRIATTTVERHLADINVKLGTRKRQDAVELAVRMGWFLPTSIPLSASQSGSHEELDEPPPLPAE